MEHGEEKRRRMTFAAAVHLAAPHTWPAAVLPVLLGTALAASEGAVLRSGTALCVLAIAVLLQSAINTLNDCRDYVSGLDRLETCGDPTDAALIYEISSPRAALALGLSFALAAAILGGVLVVFRGTAMLIYGAIALAAILLYVLPKYAVSDLPFGELLSGIAMGGVLTAAAFHAQTGCFDAALCRLCLPAVVTIGCILLVNNTSDIEKDTAGGRRTLAVCLGRKAAQILLRIAIAAAAVGVSLILALRYQRGWAAIPVLFAWLLTGADIRGLFLQPVTPARRRENMSGILAAHCRITGCYVAGIVLACLRG